METTKNTTVVATKRAPIRMDVWVEAKTLDDLNALLATVTRDEMLAALQENDPNGAYLDHLQDGSDPATREEAIGLVIDLWRDNQIVARPDVESEIEEARDAILAQVEALGADDRVKAIRAALALALIDSPIANAEAQLKEKADALDAALTDVARTANEISVVAEKTVEGTRCVCVDEADWESLCEAISEWEEKTEDFLVAQGKAVAS